MLGVEILTPSTLLSADDSIFHTFCQKKKEKEILSLPQLNPGSWIQHEKAFQI